MKRALFYVFIILSFFISNTACVKEGCTDQDAINYDSDADDNDGSCVYKDSIKKEIKQERLTRTFQLYWDNTGSSPKPHKGWKAPVSMEGRSVLLYIGHPEWDNEWTKMPFTYEGTSYYYTEQVDSKNVWVYAEGIKSGSPALKDTTTVHKAVILKNEYLKAHPELKKASYEEVQAELRSGDPLEQ